MDPYLYDLWGQRVGQGQGLLWIFFKFKIATIVVRGTDDIIKGGSLRRSESPDDNRPHREGREVEDVSEVDDAQRV